MRVGGVRRRVGLCSLCVLGLLATLAASSGDVAAQPVAAANPTAVASPSKTTAPESGVSVHLLLIDDTAEMFWTSEAIVLGHVPLNSNEIYRGWQTALRQVQGELSRRIGAHDLFRVAFVGPVRESDTTIGRGRESVAPAALLRKLSIEKVDQLERSVLNSMFDQQRDPPILKTVGGIASPLLEGRYLSIQRWSEFFGAYSGNSIEKASIYFLTNNEATSSDKRAQTLCPDNNGNNGVFFLNGEDFRKRKATDKSCRDLLLSLCPNPPVKSVTDFYQLSVSNTLVNELRRGTMRSNPWQLVVQTISVRNATLNVNLKDIGNDRVINLAREIVAPGRPPTWEAERVPAVILEAPRDGASDVVLVWSRENITKGKVDCKVPGVCTAIDKGWQVDLADWTRQAIAEHLTEISFHAEYVVPGPDAVGPRFRMKSADVVLTFQRDLVEHWNPLVGLNMSTHTVSDDELETAASQVSKFPFTAGDAKRQLAWRRDALGSIGGFLALAGFALSFVLYRRFRKDPSLGWDCQKARIVIERPEQRAVLGELRPGKRVEQGRNYDIECLLQGPSQSKILGVHRRPEDGTVEADFSSVHDWLREVAALSDGADLVLKLTILRKPQWLRPPAVPHEQIFSVKLELTPTADDLVDWTFSPDGRLPLQPGAAVRVAELRLNEPGPGFSPVKLEDIQSVDLRVNGLEAPEQLSFLFQDRWIYAVREIAPSKAPFDDTYAGVKVVTRIKGSSSTIHASVVLHPTNFAVVSWDRAPDWGQLYLWGDDQTTHAIPTVPEAWHASGGESLTAERRPVTAYVPTPIEMQETLLCSIQGNVGLSVQASCDGITAQANVKPNSSQASVPIEFLMVAERSQSMLKRFEYKLSVIVDGAPTLPVHTCILAPCDVRRRAWRAVDFGTSATTMTAGRVDEARVHVIPCRTLTLPAASSPAKTMKNFELGSALESSDVAISSILRMVPPGGTGTGATGQVQSHQIVPALPWDVMAASKNNWALSVPAKAGDLVDAATFVISALKRRLLAKTLPVGGGNASIDPAIVLEKAFAGYGQFLHHPDVAAKVKDKDGLGFACTVPNDLHGHARHRFRQAVASGLGARLDDVSLVSESDAVVAETVYRRMSRGDANWHDWIVVFDIGAGTTDMSIVEVRCHNGQLTHWMQLARWGVSRGGNDFDRIIARLCHDKLCDIALTVPAMTYVPMFGQRGASMDKLVDMAWRVREAKHRWANGPATGFLLVPIHSVVQNVDPKALPPGLTLDLGQVCVWLPAEQVDAAINEQLVDALTEVFIQSVWQAAQRARQTAAARGLVPASLPLPSRACLVVSGRAARWPGLRVRVEEQTRLLATQANASLSLDHMLDDDAKLAVATGAIRWQALLNVRKRDFSRYGIVGVLGIGDQAPLFVDATGSPVTRSLWTAARVGVWWSIMDIEPQKRVSATPNLSWIVPLMNQPVEIEGLDPDGVASGELRVQRSIEEQHDGEVETEKWSISAVGLKANGYARAMMDPAHVRVGWPVD